MNYHVEFQSSFAHGHTPLWMHSNRHGLGSLESVNGYLRSSIIRPLRTDSLRRWGVGYGVDVALPYHFTSKAIVQQAFAEVRWLHGSLSVGSKEYPMELKNNALSSGSQTFGINARPVPQVRLALPDYWMLPFGNRWLHIKGHIAYGRMTDDNWQHDFTQRQSKYVDQVLYHSKAGFLNAIYIIFVPIAGLLLFHIKTGPNVIWGILLATIALVFGIRLGDGNTLWRNKLSTPQQWRNQGCQRQHQYEGFLECVYAWRTRCARRGNCISECRRQPIGKLALPYELRRRQLVSKIIRRKIL